MAYNAQNGGVYILINGDASPLQRKLDELRGKVSKTSKQIEAELQGVFGRADISKFANSAIGSFARIRTSIRAMDADLSKHQREWANYGKQIGLAEEQAKKLAQTIGSSLHQKSINQIEASLRTLQRQTGMTTSEMIKLANEMGAVEIAGKKAFSELGIKSTKQIQKEIKNLVSAYIELKKSGVASSQDLARAQETMRRRVRELRDELRGVQPAANAAYSSLMKMGAAVVSVSAVTSAVKSLIDAMVSLDSVKVAYASIFDSEANGAARLDYVYEITQKLGLEFTSAAEAAKGFFAASKGTTLEKDAMRIFEGVSEAAAAMHLSRDEVQGIFLALSQMVSKGKISMEEMRRQLGDRLPGAFKTAADAMGVTTQAFEKLITDGKLTAEELLPKMADAFHNKWGAAAQEASKSVQSALNRLSGDWTLFKANLLDSDTVRSGIEAIHSSLKGLESVIKTLSNNKEVISAVLTGATTAAGVAMIAKYSTSIAALGTTLGALAVQAKAAAAALGTFLVANPWVAVAAAIGTATAALVYFTEKANAAEQAQKALTTAQEAAISMNKLLADQGRATLKQAEEELKSAQEQYEALVAQNQNLLQSLNDSIHTEYIPGVGEARAATDDYTTSLEELAMQTAKTGDFAALERGIRSIEAQARTAGKETDTFKRYVEQLKAVCATGIKLHVEMTGYQNVISKLFNLARAKMQLGDTFDPSQKEREQDALKNQINNIPTLWAPTKQGKIATNKNLISQYNSLKAVLSNPEKLKELGISADDAKEKLSMLGDLIKDAETKNEGLLKSLNKTGGSASKAANAQTDYAKEVANTRDHIAALQKQLELDKSDDYGKAKLEIERQYNKAINDTNASIDKRVRAKGGISAAQGEELKALKQEEASLEMQVKLIEAKNKATEKQLSHLQEQLSFYNELAEMSGNYTTSMELQSQIIDIQAQKYRDLGKIPEEMIQKWTEWKKLEASTDPFDGAYRGLKKFAAEYGNSAKQWESLTYNFAKNFESTTHQMFDDFLETGELSFDSLGKLFKQLLKDMAYYALVQPIVLSVVGGGMSGATSMAAAAGGAQSGTASLTNAASGMVQNAVISKAGGGLLDSAGSFLNSTASSLFPSTFATSGTEAVVNSGVNAFSSLSGGSSALPTQTATSMLSSGWTMGAGLVGGAIGNYLLVPALGIQQNTGSQIGSMVGGAAGSIGGGLLGSAALGATFGSAAGPIGAGLGALVGTVVGALGGSLFGGEEEEPIMGVNGTLDLSSGKVTSEWWKDNDYDRGTAEYTREFVQSSLEAAVKELNAIKKSVLTIGGESLLKEFNKALKETGSLKISETWENTSPDFEKLSRNIQKKYSETMIDAFSKTNFSSIVSGSDKNSIKNSILKAVSIMNLGEGLEDELKQKFEEGITVPLLKALDGLNPEAIGLTVDKTTLEGWATAAEALTKMDEVTGAIKELENPTSEVGKEVQSLAAQFNTWREELAALGWQTEKLNEIDKKRVKALKEYADEVIDSYTGSGLSYLKDVENINKTFFDLKSVLKEQGIDNDTLNKVGSARRQAIDNYIDDVMAQFDDVTETVASNVKKINDSFGELEEITRVTYDKRVEITQKHSEALKRYIDGVVSQYDQENAAAKALKEIADNFGQAIAAMKNSAGLYTASDIQGAQAKMTATMRKYVSSVTDAYKTTNNLQRQTDEINATFDDLVAAMRQVGMTAQDVSAVERQRAQVLSQLRSETLNGYDQDLSLRISSLNTGGTDSYAYQLLAQAYQQENERTDYEKNIGINTEQYDRLLLVQQAETLNTKIKYLQSQLRESLQTELDNSTEMLNVANGIKSTFSSILRSLKKARQDLWTSDKNLATDRYDEAYRQFNKLYARAMKGDEEALKELSSIGDTVLSLGKEQLTSRTEYNAAFYDISKKLKDAEGVASSHLDIAEKDIETQTNISDSLKRQINAVTGGTESLGATIGELESMIQVYQNQLKSLLGIINDSVESSTRTLKDAILGLNDGTSTSRQAILETKAALMNYGETLAKGQKAGNWTSESVLKEIEKSGLTFDQWYTKYGSKELIEAAKRTGTVVESIEDLQKITGAYDKLLEAKAKQLNDTMYSTSKVAAGGWTADLVRQEIASRGMTVAEWYDRYGKSEGFLLSELNATNSLEKTFKTSLDAQTKTLSESILSLNDGSKTSQRAILETKAALMNMGETLGKGQKAGNATADSVLQSIKASGLTFDQWYKKYGVNEFTEAAKRTGIVVESIEDLQKITDAYDKLLADKADTLNKSMYSTATVAAGGWTAEKVKEEIASRGMTVKEWYERYGKSEGFLLDASKGIANQTTNMGKSFSSWEELLKKKADVLNASLYSTSKVAAGGWTADLVKAEIASRGMTVQEWYEKYGRSEGYLLDTTKSLTAQTNSISKSFTSWEELLKKKADDMNKGINLAGNQAAGGWTAQKVQEEIASRGMTVEEWYKKYGKSEGYLLNTSDNTKSTSVNTNDMIKALNDYNNSQSDKILEVKAALLNMGETLGKGQSGSNWTAESVAKAIKDSGMTMSSWLSSYGGTEFANAAKKYGYTDIEKFMNDVLAGKVGTTSTSSAASTTSNSASTSSTANNNTSSSSSAAKTNTNTTSSATNTNTSSSSTTSKTTTNTNSTSSTATTASTKNTLNEKISDLTDAQKTILANKAKAMQNGFLLGSGQTAGSQWTQQKILDTIHSAKKTMQQWIDATWNKSEKSTWDALQKKSTGSSKNDLDLLIAKAAAMNKAKQSGKTNWNAKTAYDEIHRIMKKSSALESLKAWYTQSGKKEGFASGGITPRNEAFWVGEEGPELMMSPQSYGVLSNQDSMDLMRSRLMAPAVEDDSLIRETNNILRQALRKIDQLEYDNHKMRQYIQKWDNDGLPATAAY